MKNPILKLSTLLLIAGALSASNLVYAEDTTAKSPEVQTVELSRDDFHPAFTKATVIKLNAIVSRSLDVINEYDSIMAEVKKINQSAVTEQNLASQIGDINELSDKSALILSDMLEAEKELKASDEIFNKSILAGMKKFVVDVEREVTTQSLQLSQTLSKR